MAPVWEQAAWALSENLQDLTPKNVRRYRSIGPCSDFLFGDRAKYVPWISSNDTNGFGDQVINHLSQWLDRKKNLNAAGMTVFLEHPSSLQVKTRSAPIRAGYDWLQ